MAITARIRASQQGYCVENDDPRFLTLDTDRNQFKVFDSDYVTYSLTSANDYSFTKTVTHNLGYRPQALCYSYYADWPEDHGVTGEEMVKIERFTNMPFFNLRGNDADHAGIRSIIKKNTTTISFTVALAPIFAQPNLYDLIDMEMFYIIYIDRE